MSVLKIIISSTRPGRAGLPIGTWTTEAARRHGGFDRVEVLDLAEIGLPLLDEPAHPRLRQYTKPHTIAWSQEIDSADAFVIVLPEYNYSFPASIKNALDYLVAEWAYKPVGLVSYGGVAGGMRSANMLRPVLTTLRMFPVGESVAIPMFAEHLKDGVFVPIEAIEQAAEAMFSELVKLSAALAPLRARV